MVSWNRIERKIGLPDRQLDEILMLVAALQFSLFVVGQGSPGAGTLTSTLARRGCATCSKCTLLRRDNQLVFQIVQLFKGLIAPGATLIAA